MLNGVYNVKEMRTGGRAATSRVKALGVPRFPICRVEPGGGNAETVSHAA